MKDHADAEATYRKATQLFPNEARVFFEMGRLPRRREAMGPAVQNLARAVELDPKIGHTSMRWAGCRRAPAATTTAWPPS